MTWVVNMEDIIRARLHLKDFEWASRTFTPSQYFVRGEPRKPVDIVNLVLCSDNMWHSINQASKKTSKSEDEMRELAKKILVELAHDFHMYSVRWFGVALGKLSKTLYNGIQVQANMISEVREAYKKYPVILLPTHRSYVDFLLVSYVSFHYDLALPIIAAGMDFMSMAGVGEMLRKAGAFFIRRTFGNDILYWSIVSEYVRKALLVGGHPLEMFVEGTRSRSGKSLRPKIGLLSALLELVRSGEVPDVLILPIAMSYDRTLEETLYAHELLGMPKLRESTHGLVKALMWLGSQSYGSMYVNFGRPLSFRTILETERLADCSQAGSALDHVAFTKAVKHSAEAAVLSHQLCLRVPLFSTISLIVLSIVSRGTWKIRFNELVGALKRLQIILRSIHSDFGFPLQGDTMEANLRYLLRIHSGMVKDEGELVTIACPNSNDEAVILFMKFQHYANQVLPKLLPFCIATLLLKQDSDEIQYLKLNDETTIQELCDNYTFIRRLLKEDFLYPSQTESEEFRTTLSTLQYLSTAAKSTPEEFAYISTVLGRGVEPYLVSYWGVMKALLQLPPRSSVQSLEKSCDVKSIGKLAQQLLLQEMKTSLPKQYGALSLETMCNACLATVAFGAVKKIRLTNGTVGIDIADRELLTKLVARTEGLIRATIDNMNWSPMKSTLNSKI